MPFISVKEAAKASQFTPHYIRKLYREGKIIGVAVEGQNLKIDTKSLESYKKTPDYQDDIEQLKTPMRRTIKEAVEDVEDHFQSDIISYISGF